MDKRAAIREAVRVFLEMERTSGTHLLAPEAKRITDDLLDQLTDKISQQIVDFLNTVRIINADDAK